MRTSALLLVLAITFMACRQSEVSHYNSIGRQSFILEDAERDRPLNVEVWYPSLDTFAPRAASRKALFKTIESINNAHIPDGKFPLLLVSHGTGGNRFSLTWMIEKLVKEGYMVVSLGHYGNTTYHKVPREFVKWWERAIDVKFVLNTLLKEPVLSPHIDQDRMGGIGFSLGGYTNIALAGGKVDRTYHAGDEEEKGRSLPPEFPMTDEVIDFETDSAIVASYNKYKDQVKDPRLKAFFVMAPAIGFGFHTPEQMKDVTAPVYIVAGKGDTNTPIEHNALNYHELIPNSELELLGEHVDHYVFLNEPTELGKKVLPEITIDHESVDRAQIHEDVSNHAIEFFDTYLPLAD